MEENKVIYDPKIAKCIEKERLELEPKDIFQTSIIKDTIGKLKKKKNHYYVIKNLNFPIKINDALCGTSEIKIFEEQTLQNELEKINNPEIEYIYLAGLEVIIKACFREGINTPLQIWVMDDRITSSLKSSLIGLILADLIYQKIKFVIQPNFCITTRELNKAAALKLCYKLNGIDMIPGSDVMSIECRILYAYTTNHEIKRRNTERLKIPRNFQSCVSIKNIPNDEVSIPQQVVIEFNKNKQKKKLEPNRLSFTKDKLILGNTETSRRNELEISEYLKRQECSTSINYFSPTKILISVVNEPRINFLPCVISTSIERSYVKNEFIQHNQPFNIDPPRTYRNGEIEYVITQEVELALSFIDETKRELMKIHTFELVNNSEQNILLGRDFLSKIDYSLSSQYLIIDGYRIPTIN